MEKLNNFTSILGQISSVCENIIRRSVPVMKSILDDKKQLINTIKKKHPDLEEKEIKQRLQKAALFLVNDAKTIKKEFRGFIDAILQYESFENIDAPFLTEVWMGDTYDCRGVDSLIILLQDLESQLKNCTLEYVIDHVIE